MKKGALLTLILSICLYLPGQNTPQDCLGALPICTNGITISGSGFNGPGNVDDLMNINGCLINGENNSAWYKFTVTGNGSLAFDIIPTSAGDDFDFALYNLTNNNCQDILNGTLSPVRCNFSATPGTITGMRPNYVTTSAGVSGDAFLAPLQVSTGENFVLLVDSYTNSSAGYSISFDSSTTTINSTVGANQMYTDSTGLYNMNYTTVYFTHPIICSSVLTDGSQFQVSGPSQVSVDSVAVICNGLTQEVVLYFDPPISATGRYTISTIAGSGGTELSSLCGTAQNFTNVSFLVNTVVHVDFNYSIAKQSSNSVQFVNTSTISSNVNATITTNIWFFGNGATSTLLDPFHTFTTSPPYTVRLEVTTSQGATYGTYKVLPAYLFNGLEEPNSLANLSIHPNPTRGNITLMGLNSTYASLQVEVYNTLGHRVHAEQIPAGTGNNTQLNLSSQPTGIYFLRVSDGELSKTIRLVVE